MVYVRIPTELDFTNYTNLVQLTLICIENQTIKLSHHQKLEHLNLVGDLLESQLNEFHRIVFENLIFEEIFLINKIEIISYLRKPKRTNYFPALKYLLIENENESADRSKESLRYIVTNADQLQELHFYSWGGAISEHLYCESNDQSGRDEEKKAWMKTIMDQIDRMESEDSD